MNNINELFGNTGLGNASVGILTMGDIGQDIQAGLGINVGDVESSEVLLLANLVDNSGSMSGRETDVCNGTDLLYDTLAATKQAGDVLVHSRDFSTIFDPFTRLVEIDSTGKAKTDSAGKTLVRATRFRGVYRPSLGSTPLYTNTLKLLATVSAKVAEFSGNGVPVRAITGIITDGGDTTGGRPNSAAECKQVIEDLLKTDSHIIFGMGIGNPSTFRQIFSDMGIQDKWILTPGDDPKALRDAFRLVSQSAVKASQGGNMGFSQAAAGGFGT